MWNIELNFRNLAIKIEDIAHFYCVHLYSLYKFELRDL